MKLEEPLHPALHVSVSRKPCSEPRWWLQNTCSDPLILMELHILDRLPAFGKPCLSSTSGFGWCHSETDLCENYFLPTTYFWVFHSILQKSENGWLHDLCLRPHLGNTNFWIRQHLCAAGPKGSHCAKSTHAMVDPCAKEFRNTNPI